MKRYILFGGDRYYPSGGWRDKVAEGDTVEEVLAAAVGIALDWWHIIDTAAGNLVKTHYD